MTKGERIQKNLSNPNFSNDIAATEWLLLYAIKEKGQADAPYIKKRLEELWKKIHKQNTDFYLCWPSTNDGHNLITIGIDKELQRFDNMGIINIKAWKDEKTPYWSLTEKGIKVMQEWWKKVRKILSPVIVCF